jgi:hypothetical protein
MSAYVFAGILLLLILLAGYLFLSHSIEKKRIQRQRLITALRARRNSFRELATGFPAGFLSSDLTGLLYRALIDCCEQLSRIEPSDPAHAENLSLYTNLLASLKEVPAQAKARLNSAQQIKEAHHLLQELQKFVLQQSAQQLINQVQADAYTDQISRLQLQINVDGHILNARQAQQIGKVRLALHHYGLARKALITDNKQRIFDKQIAQLDAVIAKLQEKAAAASTETAAGDASATAAKTATSDDLTSKEWKQFDEENEKWKKKSIYD